MPVKKLKDYLNRMNVKFVLITHSKAFTAQEVAASIHMPGKEVAKTVMIKIDGDMAMAVVPASRRVDLEQLKQVTGAKEVSLALEEEFACLFPQCETGAMPPFGNLYGMNVFVSNALAEDEEIAFNAGSHTEVMKLSYADFASLVQPVAVVM